MYVTTILIALFALGLVASFYFYEKDETSAYTYISAIATICLGVTFIPFSIEEDRSVRYEVVNVDVAKTKSILFLDNGEELYISKRYEDINNVNDSTEIFCIITTNFWGFTDSEGYVYELDGKKYTIDNYTSTGK